MATKLDEMMYAKRLLLDRIPTESDENSKTYYLPKSVGVVARFVGGFAVTHVVVYNKDHKKIEESIMLEGVTYTDRTPARSLIGNIQIGLSNVLEAFGGNIHNAPKYTCIVQIGNKLGSKIINVVDNIDKATTLVKTLTEIFLDCCDLNYERLKAGKEEDYTMEVQNDNTTAVYRNGIMVFKAWFDIQQIGSGEQKSITSYRVTDKFGDKTDILVREVYIKELGIKEYVTTKEMVDKYLGKNHEFLQRVYSIVSEKVFYNLNDVELENYINAL